MMKKYAVSLLIPFMSFALAAQATEFASLNSKIDELEVEQEMEELEDFGEAARLETAKEETAKVDAETRQLKKEIAQMQKKSAKAEKQISKLTKKFQHKDKLARKTEARHKHTEKKFNKTQAHVQDLRAKVDSAESRVIEAVRARKTLERNIARLEREQKALQKRLKVAARALAYQKKKGRTSMAKEKRLMRKNAQLKNRLATK